MKAGADDRPGIASALLFLCVANSARSQIAEGWGRALAPNGVEIYSAGSNPGSLHPAAVQVMAELGIDISGQHSKAIDEIPRERIGTAITLCAEEVCPVFPGEVKRIHAAIPDPAAASGSAEHVLESFRRARDEIEALVRGLFSA